MNGIGQEMQVIMPDLQDALMQHSAKQRQFDAANQLAQGGNGWGGIGEILGAALGAYKSNKFGGELDKSQADINTQIAQFQEQKAQELAQMEAAKAQAEYERKKADEIAKFEREQAGKMDIARYKTDNAKSNAPVVNVNSGEVSSEFQKKMAGKNADKFNEWENQAIGANETLSNIQKLKQISQMQQTGKGQEAMAMIGQWVGSEAGANMQSYEAIQKKMMLDGAASLKGAMSDGEWSVLQAQMPAFGNDPRANEIIMGILEGASQRAINRYQDASNYVSENGKLQGYKPEFQFSGSREAPQQEQAQQSQYADGTVIENAQGQRMVMKGGKWVQQ